MWWSTSPMCWSGRSRTASWTFPGAGTALTWFLRRAGLPALKAVQGFPGFFGWLSGVGRTRRALEDAVSRGGASLVFGRSRTATHQPASLVAMAERGERFYQS